MSEQQYTLLAVDDSDDDLFLLRRALRAAPRLSLITTLRDGSEAIAYFNNSADAPNPRALPDLLVIDLKMPDVDGFDLLSWLSQLAFKPFKTVVLTSSLADSDRERALALGADAVYVKPSNAAGYQTLAKTLQAKLTGA
jgi:CheY-like chemotaxis protein